jgi:uncharacterized protein YjbI with pentapeptide repeats
MTAEGPEGALVRAGAGAINTWRKANPGKKISSERVVVSGMNLSGSDLSAAELSHARFIKCDLSHSSFAGANIQAVEFKECVLNDVDFTGANLKSTKIGAISLDGAIFGRSSTFGRLADLHIATPVTRRIIAQHPSLPWFDRWIAWDRLRFLADIRLFVPAYTSLILTVLYLSGIAWYNSLLNFFNEQGSTVLGHSDALKLLPVVPTSIHALILANFASLALASTFFLACPPRILEFSRERWLNEFQMPEILYDFSALQRPFTRIICSGALLFGGALSTFLLCRGIIMQAAFVLKNIL